MVDEEVFKLKVADFVRNNSEIIYSPEKDIDIPEGSASASNLNMGHSLNHDHSTHSLTFHSSHQNLNNNHISSTLPSFPQHSSFSPNNDTTPMIWVNNSSPSPPHTYIQNITVQSNQEQSNLMVYSPQPSSTSTTQFSNVAGDIFSAFSTSHEYFKSENYTAKPTPKLMKANSHNSISFSNYKETPPQPFHFQVRPPVLENSSNLLQMPISPVQNQHVYSQMSSNSISSCSSSSSLSDLSASFSNQVEIDLDSALLRRTSQNGARPPPPLKKSSSLTAVMQPKRIQKKKENSISTSAGNVQNLLQNVSSSLSTNVSTITPSMHFTSNEQGVLRPPHIENFHSSPSTLQIPRPVFVKSKSQGHIGIQTKLLPSLNELFGERFVEETKPHLNSSYHPNQER